MTKENQNQIISCCFTSRWDEDYIKNIFNKTGVNYIPLKPLTNEQIVTCPIGDILSSEDNSPIYKIEVFKEPGADFFVRGQLPKTLIDNLKDIGKPTEDDNKPIDSNFILSRVIKTVGELKSLSNITKEFYRG